MQYIKLDSAEREALRASLARMPAYLAESFSRLLPEQTRVPGPMGAFAPVEQVWHLADLERDGFGVRIRRLLDEDEPRLADFDGTKIAAARNYRALSLHEGLAVFARARRENLALLRTVRSSAWTRSGFQDGVGRVSLCDMPAFMAQHDTAHREEIEAWKRASAG